MRVNDMDICECGDYRRQHNAGWRACEVCEPDDGMNGRRCLMFRAFQEAHLMWKWHR